VCAFVCTCTAGALSTLAHSCGPRQGRLIDGYIRRFVAEDGRAQAPGAPHKAPKNAQSDSGTSTARAGGRKLEEAPEKGQEGQPPTPPQQQPPQQQPPQPQRLRRAVRLGMLDVTPLYLRPDAHPPSEVRVSLSLGSLPYNPHRHVLLRW